MSFTDPDFAATLEQAVLDQVSGALTTAGRPIDRVVRFSGGVPSWDCEMLAVWPGSRVSVQNTSSSGVPTGPARQIVLDFRLLLLRCVTALDQNSGKIPTAAKVDEDGVAYATDLWVATVALGRWAPNGPCTVARVDGFRPEVPQGNLSGMSALVELVVG